MTSAYDSDFLARLTARRLAELSRSRLQRGSRNDEDLSLDLDKEKRMLDMLSLVHGNYAVAEPFMRHMELYVKELRQHLQGVIDADLTSDSVLRVFTSEACIDYTVKLVDIVADIARTYDREGSYRVLELAASTLAMFSGRASALPALLKYGAVPAMIKLLSPLFPQVIVITAADALGNLSENVSARLSFRGHGGVGSLVRLLRNDVDSSVKIAAAASLSQYASLDGVVQDSVRYIGGIDLLVALLASQDANLAKVARVCLLSLRRGNPKNQAEIMNCIRNNVELAKDMYKLDSASELLRFEDELKNGSSSELYYVSSNTSMEVLSLIEELNARGGIERPHTADRYVSKIAASTHTPITPLKVPRRSLSAKSMVSSARSALTTPEYKTRDTTRSTLTTPHYGIRDSSLESFLSQDYRARSTPRSSSSNRSYRADNGHGSSPRMKELSVEKGSSLLRDSRTAAEEDWLIGTGALEGLEGEVLRRKHVARFTPEEVCMLLEEMGFDMLDLRGFRVARVDGLRLIDMSELELSVDMVLPKSRVRKVQALQKAVRTFDSIATLPQQGRISESELRLFLAYQGANNNDMYKVVKLFRTLVRMDDFEFVTFWDFVTSFDWVSQAFRIYHIRY
ncbi:hypothetical protein CEUSTIGMA_g10180.t1 [Chlamydomonas eustigma]|uniref:SAM domain-containing protein n=1 Tax=Chlamydomonas eustigma TaxID=1157962 RepID=A0A250XI50_9CHLO|nr:hypothetical protein CEUSTIGMA_g10180.t1 [Chlamydomonas eustigma]|eukprot:GAX82754.1 hypothetical protein CEUSTIGMA_g10180.t1 [Chlamydomonas eustigma]